MALKRTRKKFKEKHVVFTSGNDKLKNAFTVRSDNSTSNDIKISVVTGSW